MGLFGRKRTDEEPAPAEGTVRDEVPANENDDHARGWDAIDEALYALHGDTEPRHVSFGLPATSGNLQGASAYPAGGHWHYVSYGLSDLFDEEDVPLSFDAEGQQVSGWGYELTMRVPRDDGDDEAPVWPFLVLNKIATYVRGQGASLEAGHSLGMGGPVTGFPGIPGAPDTALTVYLLVPDPLLPATATPNGRVEFLQLLGITPAEKDRTSAEEDQAPDDLVARLSLADPLLMTDPGRAQPNSV